MSLNTSLMVSSHEESGLPYPGFIFKIKVKQPAFDKALAKYKKLVDSKSEIKQEKVPPIKTPASREVFIVHGHNDGLKEKVARFLLKLDLIPIILHEQPNMGRVLIEKFEAHAKVSYAVILMTDDDEGREKGSSDFLARARQNVILEQGYFIGNLGRKNVCTLHMEGVELPSDLLGVVYIPLDDKDAWKLDLAREIKAAGVDIDLNKAI